MFGVRSISKQARKQEEASAMVFPSLETHRPSYSPLSCGCIRPSIRVLSLALHKTEYKIKIHLCTLSLAMQEMECKVRAVKLGTWVDVFVQNREENHNKFLI